MAILLITTASFTDRSTGISQTLENLLDYLPPDDLIVYSPEKATGTFAKYRSEAFNAPGWLRHLPAFFGKLFFSAFVLPRLLQVFKQEKINLILTANLDYPSATITRRLLEKYAAKLVIYLLDDIREDHAGNDMEFCLQKADAFIYISKYMQEAYQQKFVNKPSLIAHNPVDERDIAQEIPPVRESLHVAYAGALWHMHRDAVFSFAEAIRILKESGTEASFTIFTAPHFYEWHREKLESLGVNYGGFVPFRKLKNELSRFDGLLVASSFEEEFRNLTSYSVQTKITDYLACARNVIAIGPGYSACNRFVEENACGKVIQSAEVGKIADDLGDFLALNPDAKEKMISNGLDLLRRKYRKSEVQSEFGSFLRKYES